eukprot:7302838-Prymnesium_polylepis.2
MASEGRLSVEHMRRGTDAQGQRIRILTATLACDRAERAGLTSFQYEGETIPADGAVAAVMARRPGALAGRLRHGYGEITCTAVILELTAFALCTMHRVTAPRTAADETGNFYCGHWAHDRRSGAGKIYYVCGDVYEGEWRDGMYHGRGKYYSQRKGGDEYEGEWRADKPHGHGRYFWRETGDVYEGGWVHGLREGKGREVDASGAVLEGQWECGERVSIALSDESFRAGADEYGQRIRLFTATLTCERATRANLADCEYEGDTIAAGSSDALSHFSRMKLPGRMRHGHGRIRYKSGSEYVGQWERDKRSGRGTYRYSCGDVYEGEWRDGMYHGRGKYTGSLNGGGGDEYEGGWKCDVPHGHGRYLYRASGDVYEGEWHEGQFHGRGRCVRGADGAVKDGEWKEGLLIPPWQRQALAKPRQVRMG